eukprot:TRINITY_DN4970_c0_g1_i1.p1 TRINITY_DN4970_c0_g1~~TRINITY_DN4970_c0_g1_i1.p1  ORF type:complete len:175 (-),score=43.87 TRINITY_DN4970_c0_g1_i1:8-532(-)
MAEESYSSVLCRVLLVRHGQGYHNVLDSFGKKQLHLADPSLTPKGEGEAREAFSKWKDFKFDVMYVSPLRRALQTAHLATQQLPTSQFPCPLVAHEDASEMNERSPCNHRRPLGELREEFPLVDWPLLEENGPTPGLEACKTHQEEIVLVRKRATSWQGDIERVGEWWFSAILG